MRKKLTVIIADDHPHEVEGFRDCLSFEKYIEVIDTASSPEQAVKIAIELQPDVIMLDLAWPDDPEPGFKAIRQIRQGAPDTRILAMTNYSEYIDEARRAGADKAISKHFLTPEVLEDRIRDTFESRFLPQPPPRRVEQLTPREIDVLRELCKGKTAKQIGTQLVIAEATVKSHLSTIYAKLGVEGKGGAISTAYREGIISLDM